MTGTVRISVMANSIAILTGFMGAPLDPLHLNLETSTSVNAMYEETTVYVSDGSTDALLEEVVWTGLAPGVYEVIVWEPPTNPRILVRNKTIYTFQVETPEIVEARNVKAQLVELVARLQTWAGDPLTDGLIRRVQQHIAGLDEIIRGER